MSEYNERDIIRDFEAAMRRAGIEPEFRPGEGIEVGPTADGNPRRFHVKDDARGTRNGWYILFADATPAGEFGSWKTGESVTWCAKDGGSLTPDEQRAIAQRIEAAQAAREKIRKQREGEAAKAANLLWNGAAEVAGNDHPYLQRKGVSAHGLRVAAWPVRNREGEVFRTIAGTLIIPIMDAKGKIVSLQGIFPAVDPAYGRDKDFMLGGRKRGCFFIIGRPAPGQPVAFCEGYATGETIHQATGWCVVVCWDAYNLPHVVQALREEMPSSPFVICADNDQWTKKPVDNPGVTYARRAAAAASARVVHPEFTAEQIAQWRADNGKGDDTGPTDFNDLAALASIDAVQAQVLPPLPAPMDPVDDDAEDDHAGQYVAPRTVQAFDTFNVFPEFDGKGKPLPTAVNLAELCRRIGATVRYDVIKKDIEVIIPGLRTSLDNAKEASYNELYNCLHRVRMPVGGFDGNLCSLADANQYNPVATWINSAPWDGRSRLKSFFDTVTAKPGTDTELPDGSSLKETLMRKWLLSAVAAAYSPTGVVARGVLTFVSKQNLGKTHWAKRLAPKELDVIADGLILNPADKDSVMTIVSKWIVELGEVDATFRKSDIAALKAFISKDRDSLRRPYARTDSKYARRTVFFASVNDPQFLHDPTGNTRWWTIHAEALDNAHSIDMQQVWAEVKSLFDMGESWHLSQDEVAALNRHNTQHESSKPVHDMVDAEFDWECKTTLWTDAMSATDIARAAGIDRPTQKEINEAAAYVVSKYNVETKQVTAKRLKRWMMPPRSRSSSPL